MINNENTDDGSNYVAIGGSFANVFDSNDYIALVNSPDTAGIILRTHLILEDFLNIWCSKATGTDDLFKGPFVGFKSKLSISKNLGLSEEFFDVLDKFNTIRNRYSHRRQYILEQSALDALRLSIDALPPIDRLLPCEDFSIHLGGVDTNTGKQALREYKYKGSDLNKKIIIVFCVLVMKFVIWMQAEFNLRGISYTIISDIPEPKKTS